ncbi:MAG: AraC family transcriptional regulator [Clostridiales bacterium]|nr:AraC family transcriptional regulator [Clostridiales bacterium]
MPKKIDYKRNWNNPQANSGDYYYFCSERGKIYMTSSVYMPVLSEHTHEFVELVCITEGCGIHTINGHSMRVRRGDLFLIDYGVRHNFHPLSEPFAWINCIFKPEFLSRVFSTQKSAASLLYYIFYHNTQSDPDAVSLNVNLRSEDTDICAMFEDMLIEYNDKNHGYEDILEHYLMILLTKIARRIFSTADDYVDRMSDSDVINDVISRLDNSEPGSISAKELADSYFLSQSAFSSNFKKMVGVSFLEYVTKLRVNRACELLLTTDLQISEIQSYAGYQDAKAFYRAFKKYVGMTPTQYRAQHQYDEVNIISEGKDNEDKH